MHHLIEVWFHWVLTGGYLAVFCLMALESTVFPIPSEVVIPPAAIVAATQQGAGMSLAGVVIAGTLGSWFGSAIMYWVARWLGRPAVAREQRERCDARQKSFIHWFAGFSNRLKKLSLFHAGRVARFATASTTFA